MKEMKMPQFTADAFEVTRTLRGAFTEVVQSAGADPSTPQSIVREIGLNKNLAWKISRIIQAEDDATVLDLMPGASGIEIFFKAMNKSGIDDDCISRAREAVDSYKELIRTHAGDRATLEMMGNELDDSGSQHRDEQHRKLLFRGASYVWGAQARAVLKIGIVMPSERPGYADFVSVGGFFDFRRLRPEVTWTMARRSSNNDVGDEKLGRNLEPLDPAASRDGTPPLLTEFCSHPLPTFREKETKHFVRYDLVEGEIGNTGALTCLMGMVQRGIPMIRTIDNTMGIHSARCEVPAEMMLMDMYFHESMSFAFPPKVTLRSGTDPDEQSMGAQELAFKDRLIDLGMTNSAQAVFEISNYRQIIERVFSLAGQSIGDYRGYRVKTSYPVFPSTLEMSYELPDE